MRHRGTPLGRAVAVTFLAACLAGLAIRVFAPQILDNGGRSVATGIKVGLIAITCGVLEYLAARRRN